MSEHADNRITRIFDEHRQKNTKALMPFVVGGHPTPESLPKLLKGMDAAGADIIEIGFPFSDPIADGPVIAAAMHGMVVLCRTCVDPTVSPMTTTMAYTL